MIRESAKGPFDSGSSLQSNPSEENAPKVIHVPGKQIQLAQMDCSFELLVGVARYLERIRVGGIHEQRRRGMKTQRVWQNVGEQRQYTT
jgi:hypothetical protein